MKAYCKYIHNLEAKVPDKTTLTTPPLNKSCHFNFKTKNRLMIIKLYRSV